MINEFEDLEEIKAESEDYSCPNCGAPIKFDPKTFTLECSYCGFKHQLNGQTSNVEFDLNGDESKLDKSWAQETKTVKCEGCGALNIIEKDGITSTCPFCGSNQVVDTEELAGIKPHRVLPFKYTDEEAQQIYIKWVKKKFYTPRPIKKNKIKVMVNGVYLPAWTFDTNSISSYVGRLGKHYTRTVGSGKNRRVVTETRWFRINGSINVNFDDLIVNAGKQISQNEIEAICPFSTNDSFEYDKKFLAGFSAEHYQLSLNQGWENAKKISLPIIESHILSKYTYDVKGEININPSYFNVKYKYVLIPVWIGNYTYKGKNYRFLVNGETGKLRGKAPISGWKVAFTVILIIILAALICFLAFYSSEL